MAPREGMTEREHIKWMIDLIRYRENASHFNNFFRLENGLLERYIYDLDPSKNGDLWNELRSAIKEHPMLGNDEYVKDQLNRPDMVEKGYWWYDPKNWK